MSEEPKQPKSKVNPLVRWFVVGLPLGLAIMGALSFLFYFHKRNLENAPPKPSKFAGMLRKDLSLDDYRRYMSAFRERIGPRTAEKPDNFAIAASYLDSTMGFDNMGYQVVRREFDLNGVKREHIDAELPGHAEPKHLVLVTARYDGTRDEDLAALLCLASAFTGTEHRATVRFVALFGDAKDDDAAARARYDAFVSEGGFTDVDTISINGMLLTGEAGALDKLRGFEREIAQLADAKK